MNKISELRLVCCAGLGMALLRWALLGSAWPALLRLGEAAEGTSKGRRQSQPFEDVE
jgi:hypothetical protein